MNIDVPLVLKRFVLQFPQIGELTLKRLILQFKRSWKRKNKDACLASVQFIAHLVNQQVVSTSSPTPLCVLSYAPSTQGT